MYLCLTLITYQESRTDDGSQLGERKNPAGRIWCRRKEIGEQRVRGFGRRIIGKMIELIWSFHPNYPCSLCFIFCLVCHNPNTQEKNGILYVVLRISHLGGLDFSFFLYSFIIHAFFFQLFERQKTTFP